MRESTCPAGRHQGFTLIEVLISMSILLVSILALASLQIIGSKSNRTADRMMQASAMATDLAENVRRWSYKDTRLNTSVTVNSLSSPTITSNWDMGTAAATSYTAMYGEPNDTNAITPSALGTSYQGLSPNVDGTGVAFFRYYNVYSVDLNSSGIANGLLIQIIVRWKEPGFGYRQLTATEYKWNPATMSQ